jgi:mannosyltransferase OCH1-like enzyme
MEHTIHQVYGVFNDGKPIEDIPIFDTMSQRTQAYCKEKHINYKMWDNDMCNELINKYPHYKELYENFREKIQKADFIRYLILYDEGGIYVDCDVAPIGDVSELWNNDKRKLPYNAVLGSQSKNVLYEDIFKEIIKSNKEKSKMDIYDTWKGRFVFQTTGHYMLQRVLKKHKDVPKLDILKIHTKGDVDVVSDVCPIFEDYNASIWYNDSQKVLA